MKSTLFFLIPLFIICGSCNKPRNEDISLPLEEYKKIGVPMPDNVWTLSDYLIAFSALKNLKLKRPFVLPIKDSERSGAIFSRMISFENMSFLKQESIPLSEKANMILGFLKVHSELIDVYTNIRMKKQYYHRELIDINIFGLRLVEKMIDLAHEINNSDVPSDINMKSGYRSIQVIYITSIKEILENQKHTSQYLIEDLEILTDSLSNSVLRNRNWMDSTLTNDLRLALLSVIDSTSSNYIKEKYGMLIEKL